MQYKEKSSEMWKKIHKTINILLFCFSVSATNTLTLETIYFLTHFSEWIYRPLVSGKNTITLEYVTHFPGVSQSNAELQHSNIEAKERLTVSRFMLCHCACWTEFEWHLDLDCWCSVLSFFFSNLFIFIPWDIYGPDFSGWRMAG